MRILKLIIISVLAGILLVACGQGGAGNNAGEGGVPSEEARGANPEGTEEELEQRPIIEEEEGVGEDELAPNDPAGGEEQTVVLYFADNDLMENYKIEKKITVDEGEQAAQAALQAWLEGPDHDSLSSLVPSEVVVEYVEDQGDLAVVSFSKDILNANVGSAGELFIIEQIVMIMQQFGYDQTQILVEGEVVESLFGHMTADEPFQAGDPEDFQWMEE